MSSSPITSTIPPFDFAALQKIYFNAVKNMSVEDLAELRERLKSTRISFVWKDGIIIEVITFPVKRKKFGPIRNFLIRKGEKLPINSYDGVNTISVVDENEVVYLIKLFKKENGRRKEYLWSETDWLPEGLLSSRQVSYNLGFFGSEATRPEMKIMLVNTMFPGQERFRAGDFDLDHELGVSSIGVSKGEDIFLHFRNPECEWIALSRVNGEWDLQVDKSNRNRRW